MKYVTQALIILAVSFAGELLHFVIPLPIPASIYGLLLMLAALITGIIPLDKVKDVGRFLVNIMPILFIPATVGLLDVWGILKPMLVPVIVILVVSTLLVFFVSGRVTQAVMKKGRSESEEEKDE